MYSTSYKLYIVLFLHQTTTLGSPERWGILLYIVLFLHQTTTNPHRLNKTSCCISYYSYIKPQLDAFLEVYTIVVYRTIPTSNHNITSTRSGQGAVVYRTIPTSNHNTSRQRTSCEQLYIVLFLHQTTTLLRVNSCKEALYIVLFLHQTTT